MLRQFTKNLSSNWVVYFSAALLSFFLTPFIIDHLGQAAYGVWVLVGAFSGYLGLFDFGLGFGVVRYVARYQETGEIRRRNQIVATAFYLSSMLAILVLAATAILAMQAPGWFAIPPDIIAGARAVIILIGIAVAFGFPLSIFSEALAGGLYRFDLFNMVAVATGFLRAGLIVAFLYMGWGLTGLGLAALIGISIGYIWRLILLYRKLPNLSIKPSLMNRESLKQLGGYSIYSFLIVLSGRLAFYSDSFIVGAVRGVADVAIFGIAARLAEYLRQLVFTMTKLFTPMVARFDADTDRKIMRRIFYDGSRINMLFALPLSLGLFFWGGDLISLWVGDDFKNAATILQVLLAGHLIAFVPGVGAEILVGAGRHKTLAWMSLSAAVSNIILSLILIKPLGLVGVAWGTTIPLLALSLLYLPAAVISSINGKTGEFFINAALRPLGATVIPLILMVYFSGHLDTIHKMIAVSLLTVGVYLPGAWWVGLKAAERRKIMDMIKSRNLN